MNRVRLVVVGAWCALAVAAPVLAQQRGVISGRIVDSGGLPMPGATVTLTEQNTGFTRTVVSADTGAYSITNLEPGTYTIVVEMPSFASIVVALTLNVGAFYGEAIRAGIQAVPRDQVEAADVLGLHYVDKMRFVVLPQAFRIIIPVALSQSISLFKDTSLVSTLGVADLMYQARVLSTQTYRPLEILTVAALIYFVLAFPCTLATRVLELRLARARH